MNQLPLFGWKDDRPKLKVKTPITKERVEEAKKEFEKGNGRPLLESLTDLRQYLEKIDRRLNNK